MNFLDPKLDSYVVKHTEKEPEALADLNRKTWLEILNPRMLAGHFQGRVLSMLSHMIQPKNVLEIGTFTGYSAICWAEGLTPEGVIHTIDINEELEDLAKEYAEKSGCKDQITYHIGNAIDIIPTLDLEWDLVFLDADKSNYSNYYDLVFDRVKSGGYIIADNVLWNGKVIDESTWEEVDTKAILEFNKKMQDDPRVQNVLFPIRDGLMIARKL
ncbi:class I SAM-dependent methyltransferase [bacterium SCSIO 12643]|nr:class I SAM-dependent methyltransferase [bacterium SCSIO 12643]